MGTVPAPNIVADAQQISQNPLTEYSRAVQLQGEQQQVQQARIQTQQQQLDLQDAQNAHTLGPQFLQKDANGKITGFDNEGYYNALIGSGMNPAKVMGLRQQNLTYQTGIAKLGQDQLDLQNKKNDDAYQMVEPLRQATQDPNADVNHINGVWQGLAPRLAQLGINPNTMPASFQNPQDAASKLQDFEVELGQHKQLLADAKTQGDTAAAVAKARQDNAAAAHQEYLNTITQNAKPSDFEKVIDGLYDPDDKATGGLNRQTKLMVFNAFQTGGLPAAQKVMDSAFQNVLGVQKDIAVGTNPQIQAGKVAVSTAEGVARANTEATIARGSDATLAKVPPRLVPAATAAADKADLDYAQAQSVSQRLQAMMTAAKNGNVVSYQLIPQEGALQVTTSQGVHRINMAEIQNYGGGSLWQRLQGHIGKQLTGASIPVSVLNDMAEMQQIQAEGSQTKYNNALKSINARYGSTFAPVEMDKIPANGGAQPQGGQKTLSLSTIQQAAKDHGVSLDEARRQAIAAGYTIQ